MGAEKGQKNDGRNRKDGREVIVPISMFPDIKSLSKKQREDYMIMDDQYFSFDASSKIYSVKDILRY